MPLEIAGVSIFLAFVAGFLSCASPCVLPLVPAYLGYLAGASLETDPSADLKAGRKVPALAAAGGGNHGTRTAAVAIGGGRLAPTAMPSPFLHALAFVGGFSTVFILFGVSLGVMGFFLRDQQDIILKVAGSLLIVMGLNLSGVITIPFLQQERRLEIGAGQRVGYARSFLVGTAFSAGWSPCIGPTLGAILALAISSGTAAQASVLLLAYSAGLAIPFLAMGLAFNAVTPVYQRLKKYMGVVNYISGAIIIIVGILIFTNSLINLNTLFDFGSLGDISGDA
jgi:cytochrome c-type biogenesis protein